MPRTLESQILRQIAKHGARGIHELMIELPDPGHSFSDIQNAARNLVNEDEAEFTRDHELRIPHYGH